MTTLTLVVNPESSVLSRGDRGFLPGWQRVRAVYGAALAGAVPTDAAHQPGLPDAPSHREHVSQAHSGYPPAGARRCAARLAETRLWLGFDRNEDTDVSPPPHPYGRRGGLARVRRRDRHQFRGGVAGATRPGTGRHFVNPAAAASGVHIIKSKTGPSCTGYSSQSTPPSTIRVRRHNSNGTATGVATVPFVQYVENVLPHEWIASWNAEALKAGAVAVKSYGWYWVTHYGGYFTPAEQLLRRH